MILAVLPNLIRTLLLIVIGACVGAAINWAIYQLQYFSKRKISPWQGREDKASPLKTTDYIPILGWLGLRRDTSVHGKGFWIRPLLLEITWAIGLPWFYNWQTTGGLTEGILVAPEIFETWFLVQSVLIALMFAATFIDFDEKMIPDHVTVPGTIFALLIAAFAPWSRLPVVKTTLGGKQPRILDFCSPQELTNWHHGWIGLAVALLIFAIWYLALLPKWIDWRRGLGSIKFMIAGIVRPRRKSVCDLRKTNRQPYMLTKVLTAIWIIGSVLLPIAWFTLPVVNLDSLFGAMVGLAVGGGLVWTIRIVGSFAMNQEAMGFGDVVLMAMIGAFLGWQPSLMIVFALAPCSAVFVALAIFVFTKKNELAFGPYLCFGTLVLILFWNIVWRVGSNGLFSMGGKYLFLVGIVSFVAMAVMLFGLQWIKSFFIADDDEEEFESK